MSVRPIDRVRGSLFDIDALANLSGENCNLLLVSDRTLSLMQEISLNEPNFLARYAREFVQGGFYIPVDLTVPAEVDLAQDVARNFALEVTDVSCDIVQAINELTAVMRVAVACGCNTIGQGSDGPNADEGGDVPDPIGGIEFSPPTAITDRKCKVANIIFFSLTNILTEFVAHGVEEMGALGLSLVAATITGVFGIAALGPLGGLLGVVAGLIVLLAAGAVGVGVDFATTLSQMEADEDELICALFEASSTDDARSAFSDALETAGLNDINRELVLLMIPNSVLNLLFFSTDDSEAFITSYSATNDCSTCSPPALTLSWFQVGGADAGSGDLTPDGSQRTLTSVLDGGFYRVQFFVDQDDVNTHIIVKTDPGSMDFPTCRLRCDNGAGFDVVWIHDDAGDGLGPAPEIDVVHKGDDFKLTSDAAFSIDMVIGTGVFGVC